MSLTIAPDHDLPDEPAKPSVHADPGEIVGRRAAELLHWVALAVTACADVTIFYQILAGSVLTELPELLVWLAVAGFTTCSLLLAHFAGRLVRDTRAGFGLPEHGVIRVLVCAWSLLGIAAFVVRLVVSEQDDGTAAGGSGQTAASAVLFLVLFIGSGMVSGVGAYLSRNPLRDRFRKAVRDRRSAQKRLSRSQPPYERSIQVLELHRRNRQRDDENHAAAMELRIGQIDELKATTGILIAAHLQDPSATTGLTTPRARRAE